MIVPPSKKLAILERRKQVADLYLQGWTQIAIAERLGVKQPTICEDLQWIRKQWRESAVRDFDSAREMELLKCDRIQREAREAWERSKKPVQSAVVSDDARGKHRTQKRLKHQHGDPR